MGAVFFQYSISPRFMAKFISASVFATLLLVLPFHAEAQDGFFPKSVGSLVNSGYDEVDPALSPDGNVLFFSRIKHPGNAGLNDRITKAIWYSVKTNEGWSEPVVLKNLNQGRLNSVLAVRENGKTMYVLSDRKVYRATKDDDEWRISEPLDSPGFFPLAVNNDGKVFIYESRGQLHVREADTATVITAQNKLKVSSIYLTDDGQRLYITSGRERKSDFYIIERTGCNWTDWGLHKTLSDSVNSHYADSELKTSGNGSLGVFTTIRDKKQGRDIYFVKIYEDKPYLLVHGRIINTLSGRPVKRRPVEVKTDSTSAALFTYNPDSGTYTLKLPFSHQYSIKAIAPYFSSAGVEIATKGMYEFSAREMDLKLEPLPYVRVYGKLMIKNTERVIPAYASPQIFVDGELAKDAVVDEANGTYTLNLPHGSNYYIHVSGRHFESLPELLELADKDSYEEIPLNLNADAEKMVVISGQIRDASSPGFAKMPVVKVDGVKDPIVSIDSSTLTFELRLPLREKHVIYASAPGYFPVYEVIDVSAETREVRMDRDLTLVPFQTGQVIRLNRVAFQTGKVLLDPSAFDELDMLVRFMNENPNLRIEIGAHTHSSEKISTLSMAKAVCNYLSSKGIAKNRITARGYSSTKPVVPHSSPGALAVNRRVEFAILQK